MTDRYQTDLLDLRCMDCMEMLRDTPDKAFDLAIVDPPFGIDVANMNMGAGSGQRCSKLKNRKWEKSNWDTEKPRPEYFQDLFRVSRNQIIWGGNNFHLPVSKYFAVWDKGEGMRGRSFSECEYAWVRSGGTRITSINPVDPDRIHVCQKPVALYNWLLHNYAKPGDRILDTHGGSFSLAIACHYKGFHLTGCELDPDYFRAGVERVKRETAQQELAL